MKFVIIYIMVFHRPHSFPPANKGSYSQVGFSYKVDGNEDSQLLNSDEDEEDEEEDDDDEKDFSSDDSNDEGMETIAKEFGIKRYNWLIYMDKKAKEEEKRQREVIKGDPAIVCFQVALEIFRWVPCVLLLLVWDLHIEVCREN